MVNIHKKYFLTEKLLTVSTKEVIIKLFQPVLGKEKKDGGNNEKCSFSRKT